MRRAKVRVYLHYVWATWGRAPLLRSALREQIYASICRHSHELGARVIAIGGIDDHVHLLVRLPATIAVAVFIGKVKGGSSWHATHNLGVAGGFKWQGSYGVYSVSARNVPAVKSYVLDQEAHHRGGTTNVALESDAE